MVKATFSETERTMWSACKKLSYVMVFIILGADARATEKELVHGIKLPDMYAYCEQAISTYKNTAIQFLPSEQEQMREHAWTKSVLPFWREAAREHFEAESFDKQWIGLKRQYGDMFHTESKQIVNDAKTKGQNQDQALMDYMKYWANKCASFYLPIEMARVQNQLEKEKQETQRQIEEKGRELKTLQDANAKQSRDELQLMINSWSALPDEYPYISFGRLPDIPIVTLIFSMECAECLMHIRDHWPRLMQLTADGKINIRLLHQRARYAAFSPSDKLSFADRAIATAGCTDKSSTMSSMILLVRKIEKLHGQNLGLSSDRVSSGWIRPEWLSQYDSVLTDLRKEHGFEDDTSPCKIVNTEHYAKFADASLSKMNKLGAVRIPAVIYEGVVYARPLPSQPNNTNTFEYGLERVFKDATNRRGLFVQNHAPK